MVPFLNFLAGLGSVFGSLYLMFTFSAAKSAPQEAAGAAIAVALAVIPYVLARVVQQGAEWRRQAEQHKEIMAALQRNAGADSKLEVPTAGASAANARVVVL